MGTILQSLSTRREGLLLLESFEAPNFMLDEGWSLLQGAPTRTDMVAKEGLFSLEMNATWPAIKKILDQPFQCSTVWFYDDASETGTLYSPRVQWINTSNGDAFMLGVDNAIDPGYYMQSSPSGTGPLFSFPRSTGWHRFTVKHYPALNRMELWIDNVRCLAVTYTAGSLDAITVGSYNAVDTTFGFFDWVQVFSDPYITIYNLEVAQFAQVVLSSGGAIIVKQAEQANGIGQVDVSDIDFPAQGYLQVLNGRVFFNGDRPFYQSDMQTLNSGDIYLLNLYRFGRRPTTLSIPPLAMRNDIKAVGGPKQSVFFYDQDQVSLTFRGLTEDQKDDLTRWWTTTKRGETFSVAVEESQIYLDFTQAAVTAFPNGQLVLAAPAPTPGQRLAVESSDGYIKENVKVASVSFDNNTGFYTATLDKPQAEAVLAALQVRHIYYWPFATTNVKSLAFSLEDPKTPRWTVTLSFEELIQSPSWIDFILKTT